MQQVHNAVYEIAERGDSGVATTYHIAGASEKHKEAASDELYAGFPIRVEVVDCIAEVVTKKPSPGWMGSSMRLRPFAKVAVVAALVLIVAALFVRTPSAKAITLAEICRALGNVRNVHIAHVVPGREKPVQEQWVSRGLGLYLIETGSRAVLHDIASGQMKVKQNTGSPAEIVPMSEGMLSDANEKMRGSFGLVPVSALSKLPKGSTWNPVDDEEVAVEREEGIEVYELSWVQQNPGAPAIVRKHRFYVDISMELPRKVELYRLSGDSGEYELESQKTVEYLDDEQVREAVNERFPDSDISLGQPEGISVVINSSAFSNQ
jgi:hypothetical protein